MAKRARSGVFFSFRLKSWLFLSIVFGSVFFLYITLGEHQLRSTFEQQRAEINNEKIRNFNRLISQMQNQFLESATLMAKGIKTQAFLLDPSKRAALQDYLNDLHLEMGLGGLSLYSLAEDKLVYLALAPRLDPFREQQTQAYAQQARAALTAAKPQLNLICSTRCDMLVSYPVVVENKIIGVINLTRSYQSTFALLPNDAQQFWAILQPRAQQTSQTPLRARDFLIETNLHSESVKDILRQAQQALYTPNAPSPAQPLVEQVRTSLGVHELLYIPLGSDIEISPFALSIHDVTGQIQQLNASRENILFLGALLSLIALFLTSWIVKTPLNRLTRLSKILPELAELNYQKVKEFARSGSRVPGIKDEFYLIETSSIALANELEALHDQLMNNIHGLDAEKKLIEQLINSIPMIILVSDLHGEILSKNHYANRYLSRIRLNNPKANNLRDILAFDTPEEMAALDLTHIHRTESGPYEIEARLNYDSNQIYHWRMTPISKQANQPERLICVALNITEQKQKESMLRVFANQDALTKLLNRRAFDQEINEQMDAADINDRDVTLIYVDLNKFKRVNDIGGHGKGDEMLVAIANALKKSTRDSDLVARLGGDEFAVLLIGANCESAKVVCDKIIHEVGQIQLTYEEHIFPGSVSLGLACYPHLASSPQELMHKADVAMYHSKAKGEMCYVVYAPSLETK
jgi:diguanylate cyclase (GGDEF)-like protein